MPVEFTIVECPRDAWQGLPRAIPTAEKVAYLRALISAGFRHLDAVSFVSPRRVPQMADSEAVMEGLMASGRAASSGEQLGGQAAGPGGEPGGPGARPGSRQPGSAGRDAKREPEAGGLGRGSSRSRLENALVGIEIIGIVLNAKGLERALATPGVTTIGYPFSLSSTFQRQNANQSPEQARALVAPMRERAERLGRGLVVYLSMAFGNPYGDPYSPDLVGEAVEWLRQAGVRMVSLADTVGTASAAEVARLFEAVLPRAGGMDLGLHLHTLPVQTDDKVRAACAAGCRRLDCALGGLGGCPFAGDDLVGNLPTERVLAALAALGFAGAPRPEAIAAPLTLTQEIARKYGH